MPAPRTSEKGPYGHFSDQSDAYLLTRLDTPRPWVNVLGAGTYGVALSQAGTGYSWTSAPEPIRLTRWTPDPVRDDRGRFLYVRDEKSGRFWSVGARPAAEGTEEGQALHGMGHSMLTRRADGLRAQWMLFVPPDEPLEIWRLRLSNLSSRPRSLTLWTYVEWDLGAAGSGPPLHTAFHDGSRLQTVQVRPSPWNGERYSWPGTAWHGVDLPVREASDDRRAFLGEGGSPASPLALRTGRYGRTPPRDGWDAGAGLCVPLEIKPGGERTVLFTLGAAGSRDEALVKARRFRDHAQVDLAWVRTEAFWRERLSILRVKTPDAGFDRFVNVWLPYQSLAGRAPAGPARFPRAARGPRAEKGAWESPAGVDVTRAAAAVEDLCRLHRGGEAWDIASRIFSSFAQGRGEPFAVPAYLDEGGQGLSGRDGTWSAAPAEALWRACAEGFLGLRAEPRGLRVCPCLPPHWKTAQAVRRWRGVEYRVRYVRGPGLKAGAQKILVDGKPQASDLVLPAPARVRDVHVLVGPSR